MRFTYNCRMDSESPEIEICSLRVHKLIDKKADRSFSNRESHVGRRNIGQQKRSRNLIFIFF